MAAANVFLNMIPLCLNKKMHGHSSHRLYKEKQCDGFEWLLLESLKWVRTPAMCFPACVFKLLESARIPSIHRPALELPKGRKARAPCPSLPIAQDRKSTRLNSSHLVTSYAVFCL